MAGGFRLVNPREYQRGVVLGLTLAEVLVLLVFLLLLSMGALLLRSERKQIELAAKLEPVIEALASREVAVEDIDKLADLIERGTTADHFRSQLEAATRALEGARADREKQEILLSELRDSTAEAMRVAEAAKENAELAALLERVPGMPSQPPVQKLNQLLQKMAATEAANSSLVGQNAQMRNELKRVKGNGGSGLPYCWALPDGHAQYMLRVEMLDTGVIVHDLEPRARPDDPAWPLLDSMVRDRLISMAEFIGQTNPLQGRSNNERCRYAIQVVDGTAVTNKPGYKQSMGRLWSVFMVSEVSR